MNYKDDVLKMNQGLYSQDGKWTSVSSQLLVLLGQYLVISLHLPVNVSPILHLRLYFIHKTQWWRVSNTLRCFSSFNVMEIELRSSKSTFEAQDNEKQNQTNI